MSLNILKYDDLPKGIDFKPYGDVREIENHKVQEFSGVESCRWGPLFDFIFANLLTLGLATIFMPFVRSFFWQFLAGERTIYKLVDTDSIPPALQNGGAFVEANRPPITPTVAEALQIQPKIQAPALPLTPADTTAEISVTQPKGTTPRINTPSAPAPITPKQTPIELATSNPVLDIPVELPTAENFHEDVKNWFEPIAKDGDLESQVLPGNACQSTNADAEEFVGFEMAEKQGDADSVAQALRLKLNPAPANLQGPATPQTHTLPSSIETTDESPAPEEQTSKEMTETAIRTEEKRQSPVNTPVMLPPAAEPAPEAQKPALVQPKEPEQTPAPIVTSGAVNVRSRVKELNIPMHTPDAPRHPLRPILRPKPDPIVFDSEPQNPTYTAADAKKDGKEQTREDATAPETPLISRDNESINPSSDVKHVPEIQQPAFVQPEEPAKTPAPMAPRGRGNVLSRVAGLNIPMQTPGAPRPAPRPKPDLTVINSEPQTPKEQKSEVSIAQTPLNPTDDNKSKISLDHSMWKKRTTQQGRRTPSRPQLSKKNPGE